MIIFPRMSPTPSSLSSDRPLALHFFCHLAALAGLALAVIVDSPPITENLRFGAGYVSAKPPTFFDYSDIDVIGQVAGVAMLLESRKRRHARTSTIPAKSPNP